MNLLKFSSVIFVCFYLHNANIKKCPFVIYVKKYTLLAKQNRPNITFIHNIATILDTFNISRHFLLGSPAHIECLGGFELF